VIASLLATAPAGEEPPVSSTAGAGGEVRRVGATRFAFAREPGRSYVASRGEEGKRDGAAWSTDALALAWTTDTVFAAECTRLAEGSRVLWESETPAILEIRDGKITCSLARPGRVRAGTVSLDLPAGESRIELR
jgi:hypothetical protein